MRLPAPRPSSFTSPGRAAPDQRGAALLPSLALLGATSVLLAVAAHHGLALKHFLAAESPGGAAAAAAGNPPAPSQAGALLASLGLFGASGEVVVAAELPPADLALSLKGILAPTPGGAGRAILAGPDGVERSYGAGEALPGGVTLQSIERDRVVVLRGPEPLELRLPALSQPPSQPGLEAASLPPVGMGPEEELLPEDESLPAEETME